ncbi:MAG: hypothetical protein GC190_17805 [Alphaproteobacteria bacterium]|nr:hypothetical protein [Alphaproteobacteria bacterium]
MSPNEILARALSIFMLLFVGAFMVLIAIALVRAVIPALATSILFSGLTVGSVLVPLAVIYFARVGLGHRPGESENRIYLAVFLGLVLLMAIVFAALMITGRLVLPGL